MSDFSAYTGWAIPEGVVTQVADAAGNVLWSAVEKVTITLTGSLSTSGNYVEYNGTEYASPTTFEAVVGDTISVRAGQVPSSAIIFLNGVEVSNNIAVSTYLYTVVSDATIEGKYSGSAMYTQAIMNITDANA